MASKQEVRPRSIFDSWLSEGCLDPTVERVHLVANKKKEEETKRKESHEDEEDREDEEAEWAGLSLGGARRSGPKKRGRSDGRGRRKRDGLSHSREGGKMAEEAGQATLSIERSTNERKRHTIKDRRIISVSFCHGLMMWALPHPIPSWMDVGRHCLGGACPVWGY